MHERSRYALLAMIFALSRLGYYWLGVRFDARPVLHYYQFIDPVLLQHRLAESLFYLHTQPPGWNFFVGVVLKLFPASYSIAFNVIHLLLGLGLCWCTYYLMRICGVTQWIAFTLAAWFIVSPGTVLFENYLLYEYLVAFLLAAAAAVLTHFVLYLRPPSAAAFFAILFCLVFVRNFFHLFYFLAVAMALTSLIPQCRRTVLLCAALPFALIMALYIKNWILFGSFSGSTWMGMNMDTITAHQLTKEEAHRFVARGLISPVSLLDLGSPISAYTPYIETPALTGIAVLDNCVTSTGATNFNCTPFLQVQKIYTRDGVTLLRQYPVVYFRSCATAWFTYFLPAGDFPFFDLNGFKIHTLDRVWNTVFFGQFEEATDRKELRRMFAQGRSGSLLLYTGVFLLIGLPALWLWGMYYLVTGIRHKTLTQNTAIVLGFLLVNIAYVTVIANFLSSFENNRYRFPLDAFYIVLLGIALSKPAGLNRSLDKGHTQADGRRK